MISHINNLVDRVIDNFIMIETAHEKISSKSSMFAQQVFDTIENNPTTFNDHMSLFNNYLKKRRDDL